MIKVTMTLEQLEQILTAEYHNGRQDEIHKMPSQSYADTGIDLEELQNCYPGIEVTQS